MGLMERKIIGYRLLRDLPDIRKGAIYKKSGEMYMLSDNQGVLAAAYIPLIVEYNTDWFERIYEEVFVPYQPALEEISKHVLSPITRVTQSMYYEGEVISKLKEQHNYAIDLCMQEIKAQTFDSLLFKELDKFKV